MPATTAVVELKTPQYHWGYSLSPCHTQLIHQQLTDRSSRLRSVAAVAALDYRRMSVAVLQKPLSRHKRLLGHLRRTSQYTLVTTEPSTNSPISSMRPRNKSLNLDWPGLLLTLFKRHRPCGPLNGAHPPGTNTYHEAAGWLSDSGLERPLYKCDSGACLI